MKKNALPIFLIAIIFLTACQASQAQSAPTPIKPTTTKTPTPTYQPTVTTIHSPTPKKATATAEATLKTDRQVTLMAVGDIMLGRTIGDLIQTEGPEAPFAFTAETLSSADITIGNLECPISNRGLAEEKTYTFRAPIEAAKSLANAGFDLVSLANNHTLDYGPLALQDTLDLLAANDIHAIGAGRDESEAYAPIFLEVDGLRLAFLAFADIPRSEYNYLSWEAGRDKPGIAWAHAARVREGVQAAKKQADIVIVLVHNGYEIVQRVSKFQQDTAHLAIDSGASLVIGSHPHVLQRIETYQSGLIFYSMGNFVFDNFLFPPNYSAILKVTLSPEGVETYEMIDVVVQLNGVPQIMPYDKDE